MEQACKAKVPPVITWKIINGGTSALERKTNHASTGATGSIDSGDDKVHRHKGAFRYYHG
jgi:hypothetical protein